MCASSRPPESDSPLRIEHTIPSVRFGSPQNGLNFPSKRFLKGNLMGEQAKHFYEFGRFRVSAAQRLLFRDEEVVPLTPKVFDILLTLIESSGQVISKDSLMKKVWPDTFVEEGNLTQNISLLRKALGEGQNGNQYIETVARRGYRFVAPVRELSDAANGEPSSATGSIASRGRSVRRAGSWNSRRVAFVTLIALLATAPALIYFTRGKTVDGGSALIESIAVLPFVNETPDTDAEYFSDEITESLINSLSQLPKLRVVPRSEVLNYKNQAADPRKIARELNVRAVQLEAWGV